MKIVLFGLLWMIFFTHEKRKLLAHFMYQRAARCHHSFSLDAVVNPAAHRGRSIISQLCYPYWSAKAKSGYRLSKWTNKQLSYYSAWVFNIPFFLFRSKGTFFDFTNINFDPQMRRMRRVQTRPQMDTRVIWTRASLTIFTQQPSHLHHFTESETSIVKRKPSTHHMPNMCAHLTCSVPRLCFLEDVMGQSCLYLNIHSLTKASKRKKNNIIWRCCHCHLHWIWYHWKASSSSLPFYWCSICKDPANPQRRQQAGGIFFFSYLHWDPLHFSSNRMRIPTHWTLMEKIINKLSHDRIRSYWQTRQQGGQQQSSRLFWRAHINMCTCVGVRVNWVFLVFSVCALFWLSILLSSSGRLIKHRACQELAVAIVHWRINASGRSRALIIMPFPTYWLSLLPL